MRIRPNRCILWPTYSAALQLLSCPAPVGIIPASCPTPTGYHVRFHRSRRCALGFRSRRRKNAPGPKTHPLRCAFGNRETSSERALAAISAATGFWGVVWSCRGWLSGVSGLFFCRDRIAKAFRVLSRKHYHQMAPLSRRDRTPAYFRILSRQEKRPNCRKHGHDRTQRFTTILPRQIIAAQQALPTAAYLTRSLRPTRRMVVVVMPLSWQSLLMVVWCCLAILERVSPFLMV